MIAKLKSKGGGLLALPLLMLLAPTPALAQGFLDTMLGSMLAQTDGWMQRGVEVALMIFLSLAVIEFAWHGIQLVLKKGELSDLFGGVVLKVTALGFFYTLIVFSPQWIPLISQTFETAGQRISGLPPNQLTPSGLIDQGIQISSRVFATQIGESSLLEIARSLLNSILIGFAALGVLIAFMVIAIQLFVVKVEMFLVMAGGVVMLAMSGSRWSMSFAEKYIGYAVSVGGKLIVISILAGFGVTFGQSIMSDIIADNGNLPVAQMFSIIGTSGIFAVTSYMIPSIAGSFLSGAASMSLANTAAAGGSLGSMAGSGIGRMAGVAAGAAGSALGAVAKLAAPAAAAGSIAGLAGGSSSGSAAGSIGGAAAGAAGGQSAFAGAASGGGSSPGGGASSASRSSSAAASSKDSASKDSASKGSASKGSASTGSGGATSAGGAKPGPGAPSGSGSAGQKAGFANPTQAGSGESQPSNQQAFPASQLQSGGSNGPMDYRDQERAAEKDYRARASSNPFARAMLKASDKLKGASEDASAFARRQRRPMASDGQTGGSPSIRLGMSGD